MELLLKSKYLSTELTEDLEFLNSKLLSSFAKDYINLDNIRNNTLNLQVKLNTTSQKAINYNHKMKTMELNPSLFEDEDLKHSFMREVVHMAAASENSLTKGIEQDNMFNLLNDAIASSLADSLVGNDKNELDNSKIILNLMTKLYGEDVILRSYFNNSAESLLNEMGKNHSHTMTVELLSKIESNNLIEAQKDLFQLYLEKRPTMEEIEEFKSFMVLEPNILDNNINKQDLLELKEFVNSEHSINHIKQL